MRELAPWRLLALLGRGRGPTRPHEVFARKRELPPLAQRPWRSPNGEGLQATRGWLGDSTQMRFAARKELDEKRAEYERGKIGARLVRPLMLWPLVQTCATRLARKCTPGRCGAPNLWCKVLQYG